MPKCSDGKGVGSWGCFQERRLGSRKKHGNTQWIGNFSHHVKGGSAGKGWLESKKDLDMLVMWEIFLGLDASKQGPMHSPWEGGGIPRFWNG